SCRACWMRVSSAGTSCSGAVKTMLPLARTEETCSVPRSCRTPRNLSLAIAGLLGMIPRSRATYLVTGPTIPSRDLRRRDLNLLPGHDDKGVSWSAAVPRASEGAAMKVRPLLTALVCALGVSLAPVLGADASPTVTAADLVPQAPTI